MENADVSSSQNSKYQWLRKQDLGAALPLRPSARRGYRRLRPRHRLRVEDFLLPGNYAVFVPIESIRAVGSIMAMPS
jgi:hypothetical protein